MQVFEPISQKNPLEWAHGYKSTENASFLLELELDSTVNTAPNSVNRKLITFSRAIYLKTSNLFDVFPSCKGN